MEMEDHHQFNLHQNHHYACLTDLLMNNNAPMQQPQPPPITSHHHHLPPLPETTAMMFEMMGPRGMVVNESDSGVVGCMMGGGDASSSSKGRWPRQETLTLLEIRSKLHPKFKDANHKGPLWEQVSRIMLEEYGYERSGKKCREKFENLYKYYKKTKEGKAARQDGKHYRFFRQLEALYGDNNTTNNLNLQTKKNYCDNDNNNNNNNSIGLVNSASEFDISSSENDDDDESMMTKRKRRRWKMKTKVKEFIDSQMSKLVKKQEEWLEKLVKTMEEKEKERVVREEEWRREEATRLEKEHMFWAKERAWIEARDAALIDSLNKLTTRRETIIIKPQDQEQEQEEAQEAPPHVHDDEDDDGVMMMIMGDEEIVKIQNQNEVEEDIREKYLYVSEEYLMRASETSTTIHF
ncbi:hypothetical protein PIB30_091457 [Stylosanthes scabra]|uniref:Myb-like domain-containing protein n=1 Tax=Stylosanthes scabra TaxID=79078 RepID=A0ABU6WWH5_9FABA|nr:hypothetical protein [Stylosanthes scabra]